MPARPRHSLQHVSEDVARPEVVERLDERVVRGVLGLGRIGKTNTLPDRPEIRGMIARVPHLITVDEHVDQSEKG